MFYLITPVHNEINELEELIATVQASSFKPDLWVIVDDNSDDGSSEWLDSNSENIKNIQVVHLNKKSTYMGFHISEVFQTGINEINRKIKDNDFIGFLDADIRFGKKYWQLLAEKLISESTLGIVSGALCSKNSDNSIRIEPFQRIDNPRGGLRLVKGKCFKDIGGVKFSRSWDSIMNVQARIKNWKVSLDENILAFSTRPTDNKGGNQKGEISRGRREWHLHQPFWQVFTRAVVKLLKAKFKAAGYYLYGYLNEWYNKGEQFPDPEVRRYYQVQRGKEWLTAIKCKIMKKENPHRILTSKQVNEKRIYG